jgi:glycerate 2-kinase
MKTLNCRKVAEDIFRAGVDRVIPEKLIGKEMLIRDSRLHVGSLSFSLEEIDNVYVIGAGKASALMAAEVEKILGNRITGGHVVVKYGHSCKLKHIRVAEAGHPVPDANGYAATKIVLAIAEKAGAGDLVICLLSGGGSALLADFPESSSPDEMMKLSNLLINSGADISEINAVRKHLSVVKGGQLARSVYPATLVSLILSDVIGDPLDVIASGPTAPDSSTYRLALDVLKKYDLLESTPSGIRRILLEGEAGRRPETPKNGDPIFEKTHNCLIGTNLIALEASKVMAEQLGLDAYIINDKVSGDTQDVADYLIQTARGYKDRKAVRKPACLLFGGEPTVKMTGNGLGGRNQHLALLCALKLQKTPGITILSAGSDGTDGPTDAAGAIVDAQTVADAVARGIDPVKHLGEFDSYHFFKKAGGHIITGPTMTNVMDIIVAIVE